MFSVRCCWAETAIFNILPAFCESDPACLVPYAFTFQPSAEIDVKSACRDFRRRDFDTVGCPVARLQEIEPDQNSGLAAKLTGESNVFSRDSRTYGVKVLFDILPRSSNGGRRALEFCVSLRDSKV